MTWGLLRNNKEVGEGSDHMPHINDFNDHHLPLPMGEVISNDLRVVDVWVPVHDGCINKEVPKAPIEI